MKSKEQVISEIIETLEHIFVTDYDSILLAMKNVNEYLDSVDIENHYKYNDFCVEFLDVAKEFLSHLSEETLSKLETLTIISEILSIMVKFRITDSSDDIELAKTKIMQHELRMKKLNRRDTG